MRDMFSVIIVGYTRWRVLSAAITGGRFFSDSSTNPEITSQISEFLKIIEYQPEKPSIFESRWRNHDTEKWSPSKTILSPNSGYFKKRLNIAHLTGNH